MIEYSLPNVFLLKGCYVHSRKYLTGREIPIKLNFVTYEYQSNIYFGMFYCQKLLPEMTSNRRK